LISRANFQVRILLILRPDCSLQLPKKLGSSLVAEEGLMRVGMKIRKLAAITFLVLSSFAATSVAPSKSELESMYNKAFREFDANKFDDALKDLDAIDARQPDLAESQNLRGVILMRQASYDKAEAALKKAVEIEPKFWNARFNLAEIPFLRKDWLEARNRFQALLSDSGSELQGEAGQLIQYKILLTYLLEGKENMFDSILDKFELSKDSPAIYYAKAAISLHHQNMKEAKQWITAADKIFSAKLNKLFVESFYEIGWLQKPTGESRAVLELASTAERAARAQADARSKYEQAERAFQQRDFNSALKFLDEVDAANPNQAASFNLRGEILMEQKKFDEAEAVFEKAFKADPKFREAQYNLAQIPFKKQEYGKSRERFEALFGETPGGDKNQASQLITFKIFMTLLLEGKDSRAQKVMDQFKFTVDTPALYYAQAAWAFKHNNPDEGNDWVASARKIYSPALNIVFADSFYDLGWLKTPEATGSPVPETALAKVESSPAAASPNVTVAEAASTNAPASTGSPNVTIAAATPAVVLAENKPANETASQITAAAVTNTNPESSVSPPGAAVTQSPAATPAQTTAPKRVPGRVAPAAAVTPATILAPPRIREWSKPTFADRLDQISDPQTPLVGGILLAGILVLVWLVVQQVRRNVGAIPLYSRSNPVMEPRFTGGGPITSEPPKLASRLSGGSPHLSLQLKASEPSVRRAALPYGVPGLRAAAIASALEKEVEPLEPVSFDKTVSEAAPLPPSLTPGETSPPFEEPAIAMLEPLRDKEEVSVPESAAITEHELPVVDRGYPFEESLPIGKNVIEEPPFIAEPIQPYEEPVGQGQPIPYQTPSFIVEPLMSEITQPTPESVPVRIGPEVAAEARVART
jgi:tetratricopeptide (TPR) repeat protein